mgnify:CR=1 FL=1
MADVDTPRALLVMAVQDLHDGEVAMAERLGKVHRCLADKALRDLVEQDETRAGEQRKELAEIAEALDAAPEGADNIWLRAILDDADNDCSTIARGPLRDIALAGALRKGKQAQRVSYVTARALAGALEMDEAARALLEMTERAQAADETLAVAQQRLCDDLR